MRSEREQKVACFLVAYRRALFLFVLLVSLVAAYFAKDVRIDNSIEVWFLDDDPNLVAYKEFLDRFEADEIAMLALFADDIFQRDQLARIDRITKAVENAPHINRVFSLTNVEIYENRNGDLEITRLIDRLPSTSSQSAALRKKTLSQPLLLNALVDETGQAAAVVAEMDHAGNSVEGKIELVRALEAIAHRESAPGVTILVTGTPSMDEAVFRLSEEDLVRFGPLIGLLVLVATMLVYRRASSALVPLLVVSFASLWIFGVMGFLKIDLNIISSSLFAFVLAVGVADSIHLLNNYYRRRSGQRDAPRSARSSLCSHDARPQDPEEAMRGAISDLLVPCLFTSMTTAAGLLSLLVSHLSPVREFGWLAALSVLLALLLCFLLAPATLPLVSRAPPLDKGSRLSVFLKVIAHPTRASAWAVVLVALPLVLLSGYAISKLQVGSNPMAYFKEDTPFRVNTEIVDRELGGSASVELLVQTATAGLKDPSILARLDRLERRLEQEEGVTKIISAVDQLKEMYRVMENAEVASIPPTRQHIAQLFLLMEEEEDFDRMVQDDYSVTRISGRVALSHGASLAAKVPEISAHISENYNDEQMKVTLTGYVKLMGDMERYLIDSQIKSFLLAFVVITGMMFLLLRSARLALFSMVPNLVPIAIGLGFMSAVGISLDPGTVMIACIALGLVVDDSVHFLVHLSRHLKREALRSAIAETIHETGRPIILTSIILASAFLLLALGNFNPNADFGVISGLVILLALAADLVLLPALLLVIRPRVRGRHEEKR